VHARTIYNDAVRVLVVLLLLVVLAGCREPRHAPLRVATFNIEDFPKNARQIDAAFDAIGGLGVDAIAVQEIQDPETFARAARAHLGGSWSFAHVDTMPRALEVHVGMLFDERVFTLASETVHDDTRLDGRQKSTLEVRLAPKDGGAVVQIFVVHLKAGGDGRALRARQLRALAGLVRRERKRGERTLVMGDFNATSEDDRADLETVSRAASLEWASELLPCTSFWDRDDGCATSRLDHVLAWESPSTIAATGACAEGCQLRDRCPRWADEVSDHCPVVAIFP
jgi:endonuclease/exonuclease/phosphatase family metal-dependent hydrolase